MTMTRWLCATTMATAMLLGGCGGGDEPNPVTPPVDPPKSATPAPTEPPAAVDPPAEPETPKAEEPVSLFDGKELGKWKRSDFAAGAEPKVEDGVLIVPAGEVMSGVTWQGEPPAKMNYEIELDAQRRDGNDFFCGLTFPVADSHCTLVMGGWGGGMTGLSSLNGYDASENATSQWIKYESEKWYHVRVRVTEQAIQVWLDGKQIIHADITDARVSTRIEVEMSKPLGLATYQTTGAFRNITLKKVDGPAPIEKKDDLPE